MTALSPEGYSEAVKALIAADIERFGSPLLNPEDPNLVRSLGEELAALISEGWHCLAIIHAPYAPLFVSEAPELVTCRQQLVDEYGGAENVRYYSLKTGEILLVAKQSSEQRLPTN